MNQAILCAPLEAELEKKKRREIERKKALQQETYNIGLQDVASFDFSEQKNRYDRYDRRWAKCVFCNQIKRDDELIDYLYGEGKCRKCRENGNL